MKNVDGLAMRTMSWTVPLLTIGIFVLDLLTPVGMAVSILYVVPLLLTYPSPRTRDPLYFSAVATVLTWVDVLLKQAGLTIPYALFNRTLGTMVFWIIAIALIRYKQTQHDLKSALVEQAHAEGLMMAAQEARYYADREALRAVVDRGVAEEQLRVSQLKLEGIIESAMDAIITVDEDQRIVLFNQAAEQMFGCSSREAIGQPLARFLPTRFREAHHHHIQSFGQSGVTSRRMGGLGAVWGLRADGEEFPIEASISHVTVERKKYYTAILRDITERKRIEELVVRSMERLTLATRAADIGVWDWDISKNELVWDDQMFALYGVKKQEFDGAYDAWLSGVHPDDRARCDEAIQQALRNEKPYDLEFRVQWPDGTVHVMKADGLVTWDPQGNPLRMTGTNYDISPRKQAEEQFRLVVEASPNGLLMVDERGTILLVNRQIEQQFGYERAELIGQSVERLVPQHVRSRHAGDRAAFFAHSESRAMGKGRDLYGVRKDGQEFPLEIGLNPIRTPDGMRVLASVVDISERKLAEEGLRESQRQLATLIGNLPGYVYRCQNDQDWTLLYISEGVFDLTGYTIDEYLHERSITRGEKTHPEDGVQVWKEVQTALEQHRPFEMTYRIMTKSGEVKWVWERGEGIYAADGTLSYLEGFVTDVTERKRAEHLLRQSEERYRRLITVSPYAILVNRGGCIIFANDQAIKLFGAVKADEILGKPPMDLVHPDYHAVVGERIHELLEGRSIIPAIEEKIVRMDGTSLDVEVSAARLADEEGPAILTMFRDVSERKRLQEQLRKTERVAELGTLASGMAHEIGTPMNVILGRAEYLLERVTEEPIKKGLQTIITQVERITKVMNQLLSFARRKTPERCPLDLRGVVEDSVEMFQERFSRNRIQLEMMLADSCPMVLADADQMGQIMINLIMNALHAMEDGGTLRIGMAPEKDMVKLTVADTGHGIPHEAVKKIFEPFFTTKEFGKGTGLGLTVVKGIIEEHQGSIAVESEEGMGTRFTILLPIADRKT